MECFSVANLSLPFLLDGGELEKTFESFLKATCCDENLLFLRSAKAYKEIADPEERKVVAKEVWLQYFDPCSFQQINIPNSGSQHILTDTHNELHNAPLTLFDRAVFAVENLMINDSLVQFTNSKQYAHYVENVEHQELVAGLCSCLKDGKYEDASGWIDRLKQWAIAKDKEALGTGNYAMHLAAQKNLPDVLLDLIHLATPKSLDWQDAEGNTALHLAAIYSHSNCVALLLYHGASPNVKNQRSFSARDEARRGGDCDEVFGLFLKKGTRGLRKKYPKLFNPEPATGALGLGNSKETKDRPQVPVKDANALADLCAELCNASWNNDLSATRTLLQDCDVDFFINNFNGRGQTALYCAARQGHTAIVAELVAIHSLNPDVQMVGHLGSALHASCFYSHIEICALLLYNGASYTLKNSQGLTCLQEALNVNVASLFAILDNEGLSGIKKAYPFVVIKGHKEKRRHNSSSLSHSTDAKKEVPIIKQDSSPSSRESSASTLRVEEKAKRTSPRVEPGTFEKKRKSGRQHALSPRSLDKRSEDLVNEVIKAASELELKMVETSAAMQPQHPLELEIMELLKLIRKLDDRDKFSTTIHNSPFSS